MHYLGYAISNGGKIRTNNEDNMYLNGMFREDLQLFSWEFKKEMDDSLIAAVFDGVGGAEKGEVASYLAAKGLIEIDEKPIGDGLLDYIKKVNKEIIEEADGEQMGSTYVGLVIVHNCCWFNNVGDSRGYLLRDGLLKKMTKDHNMVMELYEEGILTKEQAINHPNRHAIYQFLGMPEEEDALMEPYEHAVFSAHEGDYYLLCSDGLTDMVEEDRIRELLLEECSYEPEEALKYKANQLVREALNQGGRDNVTVLLISVLPAQED